MVKCFAYRVPITKALARTDLVEAVTMPFRKTIFHKGGYYHIYNRGVEKRRLFVEEADYRTFSKILRYYLKPRRREGENLTFPARIGFSKLGRFKNQIDLLCYILMPNHFHLILKQWEPGKIISSFMRTIGTAYAMYFNQKYNRVGTLFQGRFKAREIDTDEDLLHLSRYIHINASEAGLVQNPEDWDWSSYRVFIGTVRDDLVHVQPMLELLPEPETTSYQDFVTAQLNRDDKLKIAYLTFD